MGYAIGLLLFVAPPCFSFLCLVILPDALYSFPHIREGSLASGSAQQRSGRGPFA